MSWAASRQQDLLTSVTNGLSLPWLPEATAGTGLFLLIAGMSMWTALSGDDPRTVAAWPPAPGQLAALTAAYRFRLLDRILELG